jgi:hypothetical protein
MRKTILLAAIPLALLVMLAADGMQPLKVKTGLWQVTMTTTIEGVGRPHTVTYQSCVTKENLNEYLFAERDNNCKYGVQSSTGSQMNVSGSCMPREGGNADFKLQFDVLDSENVKGTGQLTFAGHQGAMHGEYSGKGKWTAATCSSGK